MSAESSAWHRRGWHKHLAACLLALSSAAFADRDAATHRYTRSWNNEDGLRGSQVWAVLQDRVGHLWLGTNEGLVRFDGVTFQLWREFGGVALPGGSVRALALASDGAMWIGFGATGGVSRVFENRLTNYSNDDGLPGSNVLDVLADSRGGAWAASLVGLSRLDGERWTQVTATEGLSASRVSALLEDRAGTIWVGSDQGVFARPADGKTFTRMSAMVAADFTQDASGVVWAVGGAGLVAISGVERRIALPVSDGTRLLHDRSGALWVGTLGGGVLHVDPFRTDPVVHLYRGESILTSDLVRSLFEDREGNVWVGTQSGLNRLSDGVVSMVPLGAGERLVRAVTLDDASAVWIATSDGLYRMENGTPRRFGRDDGLPSASVRALHNEPGRGVWVATDGGVVLMTRQGVRPGPTQQPPMGQVVGLTVDRRRNVWIGEISAGLVRLGEAHDQMRDDAPVGTKPPFTIYGDASGRVWTGYFDGTLQVRDGDHVRTFGRSDGFVGGMVTTLHESPAGTLWIGSSKGLSRYRDGRFDSVGWSSGLPGNVIGAIVPDGLGQLWLASSAGILRVALADLERSFGDRSHTVPFVLYDASDGLRGDPISFGTPTAAYAADGRLWFVTSDGVALMDVHQAAKRREPPAMLIEGVVADTRAVPIDAGRSLPPHTSHLQINYAGLSLRAPEKVRFQYLMEGFDASWVDAGVRRQAFYTNLPPGSYRFRVRAENDGVPSQSEATWTFAITPAFYQTRWFQLLLMGVAVATATMAWRLRVRQVRSEYSLILVERSRMAREIHDTLLQSLLGVLLRLGDTEETVLTSPDTARQQLGRLRQQLEFYIREARQSIRDLRSPLLQTRDLVAALRETGERLVAGRAGFQFDATGPARRAPVRIEEHVLRIAQEAISNAVRHGSPTTVRVSLRYDSTSMTLQVEDDGVGFDGSEVTDDSEGHWGITSMRERTAQVEGRLELRTTRGLGTSIELHVPLGVA